MTRDEALKEADAILQGLLAAGDEELFAAATDANGNVDQAKLVSAALRARERLADRILQQDHDRSCQNHT